MNESDTLDPALEPKATPSHEGSPAQKLTVSAAPHIHSGASASRILLQVIAALVLAAGVSVVLYGVHALLLIAASIATACAAEWVAATVGGRKPASPDAGAALTGLLLALSLPPRMGIWGAVLGSLFAIVVVKLACGGIGRNFLNPALAGRAFCMLLFPAVFVRAGGWSLPSGLPNGESLVNLFLGYQGGWLGSGSAVVLLAGAAALMVLRVIDFSIPAAFLATAFVLSWAATGHAIFHAAGPVEAACRIMSGGVPLVALFMATDPVTSPMSGRGRILFGIGCGLLTFLLDRFGSPNDAAMYAVLAMNCVVPFLDRNATGKPVRRLFRAAKMSRRQAPVLPEVKEEPAAVVPPLEQPVVEEEKELR